MAERLPAREITITSGPAEHHLTPGHIEVSFAEGERQCEEMLGSWFADLYPAQEGIPGVQRFADAVNAPAPGAAQEALLEPIALALVDAMAAEAAGHIGQGFQILLGVIEDIIGYADNAVDEMQYYAVTGQYFTSSAGMTVEELETYCTARNRATQPRRDDFDLSAEQGQPAATLAPGAHRALGSGDK